jgi:hypothetical protein
VKDFTNKNTKDTKFSVLLVVNLIGVDAAQFGRGAETGFHF